MKLGGCPPSGGGGRSGRRALIGTARACLCWGFAGGLGAWVLAVCGLVGGPIANFTVGFARVLPAVAGQGNPRPDGSAARRMRASVHITCRCRQGGRGSGWMPLQIVSSMSFQVFLPPLHGAQLSIWASTENTAWCLLLRLPRRQIRWWRCCVVEAPPRGSGGMGRSAGRTPSQRINQRQIFPEGPS